jgi:hypothetical protein
LAGTYFTVAARQQQQQEDAMWRSTSYASASVGTDRDFMWGFMLGFFCWIHHAGLGMDAYSTSQTKTWNIDWDFLPTC